ncbi:MULTISPECIES: NAD(+)/NADH kinase [Clostridium]|uniref:NAD kinase n=2 Tax=Clostridium TaxID=1485 RepID=A0A151AQA9_9CLOT|nr:MULTISPECIES: NAD(+)/NADH kinase [Clostridium]MBE6078982.1 NAD(+)/NADH kinase [Clostridium lundense]KYH29824.1 NAD kinase [Clostridium colicanis DSM 13634]MBE6042717.1 NAD(+)/NADH kinase [Clostridium thermopalmarium]PRR75205.1 putative inorganic polyphosphate/ATP-NAD kinase [Clostridium thermopalmarium DSM 5974]PVZ27961.1 NAD+ kinase [Clostridium thermopalmarium DSM 5974]
MKNIGLNINSSKFIDENIIENIINKITQSIKGVEVKIYRDSIDLDRIKSKELDMIIVLGGDGTILRTARTVARFEVPILGINMGHLGFLTAVEILEIEKAIENIGKGSYTIEDRMMLQCEINIDGNTKLYNSLNDIVVSKGTLSRILNYEIYINDKFYTSFNSDGVIISTPTGSTAYALSAGGPIVYPTLDVISLIPICPHSMHMRSIILESSSKISIIVNSKNEQVFLTIDGQEAIDLEKCRRIEVKKYSFKCKLVRINGYNYFEVLRKKIF